MSQSSAIVQRSAVANLHQSSVWDLSFKPSKSFESRPIVHTPHPFRFKLGSNLDTFASLTLKDRLLSKKISGMSQKRKLDTRSGITGKSTLENLQRMIQPESKKMKPKMSNTKQSQEVPTVTPQKHVNKLELYRQALQCKEHEQKVAANSKSQRSTPIKTPEKNIGISDASLSANTNESSPRILGLKKGCTFSKGVAP